jgi:hypothetical protein
MASDVTKDGFEASVRRPRRGIGDDQLHPGQATSVRTRLRLIKLPDLLDHPVGHPDDPTGLFWIRLERQASNVSSPDPSETDQSDAQHQATDLAVR